MALSKTTQDHDEIRKWAEARGAIPSEVASTERGGQTGILRFEFPDAPNAKDSNLAEISWDEFFEKFDQSGLALVYQDVTAEGAQSNFNKLIHPENDKSGGKSSSRSGAGKKSSGDSSTKKASGSSAAKKASGSSAAKKSSGSSAKKSDGGSSSKKSSSASGRTPAKSAAKKSSGSGAAAKKSAAKKAATSGKSGTKSAAKGSSSGRGGAAQNSAAKKSSTAKKAPAKKSSGTQGRSSGRR